MNQDDGFLVTLPPELMAEAVLLRQRNFYSERAEFPGSLRRRSQANLPAAPLSAPELQQSNPPSTPLLPARLISALLNLFRVRTCECIATVHRLVRIMSSFAQTRSALLQALYDVCVSFVKGRTRGAISPHRPIWVAPALILTRCLNTFRFMSKSSCRNPVLLWFLQPAAPSGHCPIEDILQLLPLLRSDVSESSLTAFFGLLDDILSIFKDSSEAPVVLCDVPITVPDLSRAAPWSWWQSPIRGYAHRASSF